MAAAAISGTSSCSAMARTSCSVRPHRAMQSSRLIMVNLDAIHCRRVRAHARPDDARGDGRVFLRPGDHEANASGSLFAVDGARTTVARLYGSVQLSQTSD